MCEAGRLVLTSQVPRKQSVWPATFRVTIFGSRSRAHSAAESQMSSLSESLNSRTFGQRIAQRRLIFDWEDEKFDDCLLRAL